MHSIEDDLQEIERRIASIREKLNPESEFTVTQTSGSQVEAIFSDINNPEIKYYKKGEHSQWLFTLSVNKPGFSSGVKIDGLDEGEWHFMLLDGTQKIAVDSVILKEGFKDILSGYWDSEHTPKDAPENVRKL